VRLYISLLVFILITTNLSGQNIKTEKHTYFDASWQETNVKNARYHVRHTKLGDTTWLIDTYNYYGPMIRSGVYKDEQASVPHGLLAWYNSQGRLDSSRDFYEGLPHGQWMIYKDTTLMEWRKYYRGTLVEMKDGATYIADLRKHADTLDETGKESFFPGGDPKWMRYLNENAKYPRQLIKREIQGKVRVNFIVGPSGFITVAYLTRSVSMLLDDQLLNLIKNSPRWEPATISGRPVNSYRIQELNFGLQESGRKGK
jgi:hypothetical protein